MNAAQREAIESSISTPLIILAGPGSGKTTTLVHRVLHLQRQRELAGSQFLVLTFSANAAAETKQRFVQLLSSSSSSSSSGMVPNLAPCAEITTFHSFSFKLVTAHWRKLGFASPPQVITYSEAIKEVEALARETSCLSHLVAGDPKSKEYRARLKGFLALLTDCKSAAAPLQHLAAHDRQVSAADAAKIFNRFQQRLCEAGFVQFADMIPLALKLFEENDDVLQGVRGRYAAVLADEYQDTNCVQLRLLLLLGDHGRVTGASCACMPRSYTHPHPPTLTLHFRHSCRGGAYLLQWWATWTRTSSRSKAPTAATSACSRTIF